MMMAGLTITDRQEQQARNNQLSCSSSSSLHDIMEEPSAVATTSTSSTISGTSTTNTNNKRKRIVSMDLPEEFLTPTSNGRNSEESPECCNPKRRFARRNSKCPSMFFQMLSPSNLMDLQRTAAEALSPRSSPVFVVAGALNHHPSPNSPRRSIPPPTTGTTLPRRMSSIVSSSSSEGGACYNNKRATLSILSEALDLSSHHLMHEMDERALLRE